MNGEWIYEERLDRWHLVEAGEDGEDGPAYVTWCGLEFPIQGAVTKDGAHINGLADAVHDECFRKSEMLDEIRYLPDNAPTLDELA